MWVTDLELPRLAVDDREARHMLPQDVVPEGYRAAMDWVVVKRSNKFRDQYRRYIAIINVPSPISGTVYMLALRVQGFVHSCNFRPVGNWS